MGYPTLRMNPLRGLRATLVAMALLLPSSLAAEDHPRVYLRLAEGIPRPVEEVASTLQGALKGANWQVLASFGCGVVVDRCDHRSHVVVAYRQAHRARLLAYGNHAAFAIPVRFVVYEDEKGVGIGSTNPANLNRTIVDEGSRPEDWADMASEIRAVVQAAFPGHASTGEYGQERKEARIGRTLGVMAGGKFTEKFKDVLTRPAGDDDPIAIAHRIADELPVGAQWSWGLRPAYVLELPENRMAIVGVTGHAMEVKAASIVGSGGMDDRKEMACPGIDHAAAFPIEVSVAVVDGELQVRVVDTMYRMKMYFEDAGKVAFAKNMGMPGSIEDEIKDKIRSILN